MDVGHAKGKTITPDTALSGVGVPLHPGAEKFYNCLLYTSPSPRDRTRSRMPSSA